MIPCNVHMTSDLVYTSNSPRHAQQHDMLGCVCCQPRVDCCLVVPFPPPLFLATDWVYKGCWPHLIAIGGDASELSQLDLCAPVGTVPHKGNVASASLLVDVALVVRLSILHSPAMKLSAMVTCQAAATSRGRGFKESE